MRFVQEDEAVVGNESCVNPAMFRSPVRRRETAGASRSDRRWMPRWSVQRIPRPGFRAVHPPTQRMHGERAFATRVYRSAAGEVPQTISHRLQDAAVGTIEPLGQTPGALVGFVHDDPPIHHEEDSARCRNSTGTRGFGVGLGGEGEHGDVQAGRLAGPCRQGDGTGQDRGSSSPREAWPTAVRSASSEAFMTLLARADCHANGAASSPQSSAKNSGKSVWSSLAISGTGHPFHDAERSAIGRALLASGRHATPKIRVSRNRIHHGPN